MNFKLVRPQLTQKRNRIPHRTASNTLTSSGLGAHLRNLTVRGSIAEIHEKCGPYFLSDLKCDSLTPSQYILSVDFPTTVLLSMAFSGSGCFPPTPHPTSLSTPELPASAVSTLPLQDPRHIYPSSPHHNDQKKNITHNAARAFPR